MGAALKTIPGVKDLPPGLRSKLNFGDGEVMRYDEKQQLTDAHDRCGFPIVYNVGDVLVLDNIRWTHAKRSFFPKEGEVRKLGVVMGESFNRRGAMWTVRSKL